MRIGRSVLGGRRIPRGIPGSTDALRQKIEHRYGRRNLAYGYTLEVAQYKGELGPSVGVRKNHRLIRVWSLLDAIQWGVTQFIKAHLPFLNVVPVFNWLHSVASKWGWVPRLPTPRISTML